MIDGEKNMHASGGGGGGGCFLAFFFCHETIDGEQVEDNPDRTDEFVNTK
jgi:mevalonate kinase